MTDIHAGPKPHLEALDRNLRSLFEYLSVYKIGPTWVRLQVEVAIQQTRAATKAAK